MRRRRRVGIVTALCLAGAVPAAQAAGANLLANGDFEGSGSGSLSGWKGSNATLSLVAGDGGGHGASAALSTTATSYGIAASAKVVTGATAGTAYTADGRFLAPAAKTVCLKLKETGTQPASVTSCATGTGAWASLPQLSYTIKANGDSLAFSVIQKHAVSGDSFVVDNLAVASSGGGGGGGGIAAQWNMDELTGTTAHDSSGNGNDGALTDVTLGLPGVTGAGGDYAYGFNGTSSTMIVPASSSLVAGSNDVTVTVHARTSVRPGAGTHDFDLFSEGGYQVEIFPVNGLAQARCKFIGSTSKQVLQAGPDLIDGAWHTITCHKGPSSVSLTVDGTTFTQSGVVGTIKATPAQAYIGVGSDGTDYYNGLLDDLTVKIG